MKNWSLGYQLLRYYVRFALWLSHKRIIVTGRKQIPLGKPIIFAANHQNALMDSLAIVCTNPSQSVWLARADIFKSKIARPVLKFLKMAPVYRIRDGKDNLANNEQIFASVTKLLENNDTTSLFPEAAHSGQRQMLSHKKAIPRISLEAENKNNFQLRLQIVPVGIYYSHYWAFNRTVIVQYGEPIEVDKYQTDYLNNPQKAMLTLRDEIHDRLVPLTMQINSIPLYHDYENMRQLAGKSYSKTRQFSKNPTLQLFHAENALIKKLENQESSQPEAFARLIDQTRQYFLELEGKSLTDPFIRTASKANWAGFLMHFCMTILTLPIFIAGFLFNALPFYVPRNLLKKKIKDLAFTATFNFGSGLVIYPVVYLIEAGIVLAISKSWIIAISVLILMPFVGKITYKLLEFYTCVLHEIRFLAGNKSFRNTIQKLIKQRAELIESIIQ
jgi:1-acyl-sn-glycerol-3-phosphate acyltransferase